MLNTDFFHTEVPPRPMGKYAHIVMLGELNRARVSAGTALDSPIMTRITLFKRKQTTPERLNGRELLRYHGLLSSSEDEDDPESCIYNVKSCRKCPDCITYGFAIGDGGSEKSKVYADTAFSLTDYATSHEVFTLNAPYEDGTMSDRGEVTSRINQQDHVKPQTIFPAVVTTRDLTANLFVYVLQNVLRTTRYGATTTRGGTMCNHIAAIVLSDGEIFSNLLFTQRLYDLLQPADTDPVAVNQALQAAEQVIPELLAADGVRDQQVLMGDDLQSFLQQVRETDDDALRAQLERANSEAQTYHKAYIAKPDKKTGKK